MMNNTLKKQCKVNPGAIIEGKWHHKKYTIIKELGYGANGIVYLAQDQNKEVALKMSDSSYSITSEVNVLKSFAKVQGSFLGPCLLDVDDWESAGGRVSFYVMEYIKGPDFLTFVQQKGSSWLSVTIIQLLSDLQTLHDHGWVFGDLKPENLIVMGPPPRVRCIDVGGTTQTGRAIKEFTEFYDRGYWGLGSRKAEPSYDLFAVAMIMINTAYPKRFTKSVGGSKQLREQIRKSSELLMYESILMKAIEGKYRSANEMRKELLNLASTQSGITQKKPSYKAQTRSHSQARTRSHTQTGNKVQTQKQTHARVNPKVQAQAQPNTNKQFRPAPTNQNRPQKRKEGSFIESIFIFMIVTVLYMVYIIEML